MIEIAPDRRRIEAEPDFEAHERAVAAAREIVAALVRMAPDMRRVAETRTFIALGCASIGEYAVRLGLTAEDGRKLLRLAGSLDEDALADWTPTAEAPGAAPNTVRDAVLSGRISVEQAALAGRLLSTPGLLRDGENAVQMAVTMPTRQMRSLIRLREEELEQAQPVVPFALAVTPRAKDDFARARIVASEEAGEMLTEGETFAVVVAHYLDSFDVLRRPGRTRTLPDTSELPWKRGIPAEVKRAVRARAHERCEVPACTHRAFLEFAHIDPHRSGGCREARNLLRVCHRHHVLLDAGRIRFVAWDEGGRPMFEDVRGLPLDERPTHIAPRQREGDEGFGPSEPGAWQVAERPPPAWVA